MSERGKKDGRGDKVGMARVGTPERSGDERSEDPRSAGGPTLEGARAQYIPPDPEVAERPVRRRYTAEYKMRILAEMDTAPDGQKGRILRREGLYSSDIARWRKQREKGQMIGLAGQKRGRKPLPKNPLAKRVAELERENRKLQGKLRQAEIIIEVQKKTSELLGIPLSSDDSDETS